MGWRMVRQSPLLVLTSKPMEAWTAPGSNPASQPMASAMASSIESKRPSRWGWGWKKASVSR